MKKIISLLLALTMVFALCACGTAEKTEEQKVQLAEISQMLDTAYSNYKSASTIILKVFL